MKISMNTCDRCGEQISSDPVHILICGKRKTVKLYQELFQQKDFCKECIEEIIAFALNKDACDECMREMEEKAGLLRAADKAAGFSPNMEKYNDVMTTYLGEPINAVEKRGSEGKKVSDPTEIDWALALDRMQQANSTIESPY